MQIRYLIGICHAQNSACATSDLDPPTYQISSRWVIQIPRYAPDKKPWTADAARRTDIWITKSLPDETKTHYKQILTNKNILHMEE